jgi:hypothetical protein
VAGRSGVGDGGRCCRDPMVGAAGGAATGALLPHADVQTARIDPG